MSLFKHYKTDETKENDGVELDLGIVNDDGTIPLFYVAYNGKGNKKWQKTLQAAIKPVKRQADLGTLSEEKSEAIMVGVFVDSVLKGWKNIQDEAGKNLPYSRENAVALFKKLPKLYDDLSKLAADMAMFKAEDLEAEAKN